MSPTLKDILVSASQDDNTTNTLKLWAFASEPTASWYDPPLKWILPRDLACIQELCFSSVETSLDNPFCNQGATLSQANLLLLAKTQIIAMQINCVQPRDIQPQNEIMILERIAPTCRTTEVSLSKTNPKTATPAIEARQVCPCLNHYPMVVRTSDKFLEVDLLGIFSMAPLPLYQQVLLSLLQQLTPSSKSQIDYSFEKGSSDSELQQNQLNTGSSMQEKVEVTPDPRNEALPIRNELARLISQRRYEEAFVISLQRTDRSVLSWFCSEFLLGILSMDPLPLSQRVLLSLVQQRLTLDLNKDISQKFNWITYLAAVIDPMIAFDVKPIFEQFHQRLHYQCHSPLLGGTQFLSIRPPLSGTQLLSVRPLLLVIESLVEPM
ncbi:hypothetical protein K1719_013422 [Acacia pycnantha]|nr:hypothetical protein K1719_013422 [Acacia pycnantha]